MGTHSNEGGKVPHSDKPGSGHRSTQRHDAPAAAPGSEGVGRPPASLSSPGQVPASSPSCYCASDRPATEGKCPRPPPSLGSLNLLKQFPELREACYLLDCPSGTAREATPRAWSEGRGARAPRAAIPAPPCPPPEALQPHPPAFPGGVIPQPGLIRAWPPATHPTPGV